MGKIINLFDIAQAAISEFSGIKSVLLEWEDGDTVFSYQGECWEFDPISGGVHPVRYDDQRGWV